MLISLSFDGFINLLTFLLFHGATYDSSPKFSGVEGEMDFRLFSHFIAQIQSSERKIVVGTWKFIGTSFWRFSVICTVFQPQSSADL